MAEFQVNWYRRKIVPEDNGDLIWKIVAFSHTGRILHESSKCTKKNYTHALIYADMYAHKIKWLQKWIQMYMKMQIKLNGKNTPSQS